MGAAASSSPPPPLEAATAASDPPTPPPVAVAPPAKEDPQHPATAPPAGGAADGASADAGGGGAADAAETVVLDASATAGEVAEGDEEPGECGYSLFMMGGGCKEEFFAWQKCMREAEAEAKTGGFSIMERCQDDKAALWKCMDAHADYYEPILQGERARAAGDLEAFEAQAAAFASSVRALEEGMKKQAAGAAGLPSEKDHEKQVAEVEEEQGECGFCLFMKGGGCKEEFVAWEKCVEEAEAETDGVDVVERCQDVTAALRKCMDAHPDYYEPILRAERAMAADLEAFQAQEAASASSLPASEEGQKKQAAGAAGPPSEKGQEKQVAEVAFSEKESRDPAA